ncbi:Uncharacterised protein family LpqV [Mycobacteriaceae bacterium]
MFCTRHRTAVGAAALVAAIALIGCSSTTDNGSQSSAASTDQAGAPTVTESVGLSPAGVTTRIDVPAQSTEEQYAQACMTAREWMDARGGDPQTMVEPYLKEIQASPEAGRATFQKTWSDLSTAQQAAVIIAVQAAADGGC